MKNKLFGSFASVDKETKKKPKERETSIRILLCNKSI